MERDYEKRRESKVGLRSCMVDMKVLKPECMLGWTVDARVSEGHLDLGRLP